MSLLEIGPMSTVLDQVVYFDQLKATLHRFGIDPDDVCLVGS